MKQYRKMLFQENIEKPCSNYFHKFCFSLCKKYIDNKMLLDVGCWSGSFELYVRTSQIVAIDIEKKALMIGKRFCSGANFILASALYLPFRREIFDVVSMWNLIEHIPIKTEIRVFLESNRILKPSGFLFLSTENDHPVANCLDPAWALAGHRHYSLTSLNELLRTSGFVVKTVHYKGGFTRALFIVIFYIFKHILHRAMPQIRAVDCLIEKKWRKEGFTVIFLIAKRLHNISKWSLKVNSWKRAKLID
jgi:ubiquinone/menaquinone biosynthesis C-methylase UbiE